LQIFAQLALSRTGHWRFLGAVCKEWEALYAAIKAQQLRSETGRLYNNYDEFVLCGTKTTLSSAAVATPATARLAVECGLNLRSEGSGWKAQAVAGMHADMQTLTTLRELGMPLSKTFFEAVAVSGRLHILQQFLTDQHCPRPSDLSWYAARSGSISMLDWLRSKGRCVTDRVTCAGAVYAGHIPALQYLRDAGCVWDEGYIATHASAE
jgi:hypothetical protein